MFSTPLFGAVCFFDEIDEIKFGFVISKKISKRAVDRNKIKRRMCEILRKDLNKFKSGTKIVFLAKKSLLEVKMSELEKEISKVCQSLSSSVSQKNQNPPPVKPESSLDEGRKF